MDSFPSVLASSPICLHLLCYAKEKKWVVCYASFCLDCPRAADVSPEGRGRKDAQMSGSGLLCRQTESWPCSAGTGLPVPKAYVRDGEGFFLRERSDRSGGDGYKLEVGRFRH